MTEISSLEDLLWEVEDFQRQLEVLRGRLLSAIPGESIDSKKHSLLLCRVGDQRAAVPLEDVSEVILRVELSPLPDAPPWVPGLVNLRGDCFPVLDVQARFEKAAQPPRLSDLIVICRVGERNLGLIVQEIQDVDVFPAGALESLPPEATLAAFLQGVLKADDEPILLLSIPRLLAIAEPEEQEEPEEPEK